MTASLYLRELDFHQAPWPLLLLADPSREQVLSYLPQSRLLAMLDGERAVGVVVVTPGDNGEAEITNLAVDEAWQGRGLGRRLLESAIERARDGGLRRLCIATGNSSLAQLGLYQRLGFRIVGVEPDHFLRHYPEPIFENGIQCRDQIRLAIELNP
ncbi:GNAT family N-acetyltransferase [Pseudomonas sp. PDNC002]|uniref:GNAT family N-acetyltransferase n=1 Tax=Pseudomonas sp. PDNC002 TaxID=2811422 RepID=UPI0019627106|nr:GNAT family N-acetyltransferase [Pseudomonas sp. PDNC002]QRY80721.1 GNAT family N-acetyltransferase [Pseudomonas sp. PDNC002]